MKKLLQYIYNLIRGEIMTRGGLQPRGTFLISRSGRKLLDDVSLRLSVPNLVGAYHQALRQFWEWYGLGNRSLLVSESNKVKEVMSGEYPGVIFTTSDLFPELMSDSPSDLPDHIWDVCLDPPPGLASMSFDSIVCHALLEHVIDPTSAILHMLSLLNSGGLLYLMTHTPAYHKHSYPRDYVRFHHDYFEDLPAYLEKRNGLFVELLEMYSRGGVVCVCYRKLTIPVGRPAL